MRQRLEKFTFLSSTLAVLLVLFLVACGLVDMGGSSGNGQRRIYVNDAAKNDSLPRTLVSSSKGVFFIMQPGKSYSFKVEGAVTGDYLQLLAASGNVYGFWQNVQGTLVNGTMTFTVRDSVATAPTYYLATLRSAAGGPGTLPTKVRLVPTNPTSPDTVKVKLLLVRNLGDLSTATQKNAFAASFLTKLGNLYTGYGIDLETSYEIVEPDLPALSVDFNGTTILPAITRQANTIYLYLVQSITNNGLPAVGGTFLGFAPREAINFATDEVILSAAAGVDPNTIAVTAAHEMGHFLGLRHTTATSLDKEGDNDLTNFDDGFDGTAPCPVLTKRSGVTYLYQDIHLPGERPYCLRISADNNCPASCTDKSNLMFAYKCDDDAYTQEALVPEQTTLLKQNTSLFQR